MQDSILITTKKVLGIDEGDDTFDLDITMHINSVFSDLHQLAVGPIPDQFFIEDDKPTWADFLNHLALPVMSVKSYMFLRVKLLFDPPPTSFAIESMQKQVDRLEWRLNVAMEEVYNT